MTDRLLLLPGGYSWAQGKLELQRMAINFPYWDLHEVSLGSWHGESPPPPKSPLVRSISLCSQNRTGRSHVRVEPSAYRSLEQPEGLLGVPLSARAASNGNWTGLSHCSGSLSMRNESRRNQQWQLSLAVLEGKGWFRGKLCRGFSYTGEGVSWVSSLLTAGYLWCLQTPMRQWAVMVHTRGWGCLDFSHPEFSHPEYSHLKFSHQLSTTALLTWEATKLTTCIISNQEREIVPSFLLRDAQWPSAGCSDNQQDQCCMSIPPWQCWARGHLHQLWFTPLLTGASWSPDVFKNTL